MRIAVSDIETEQLEHSECLWLCGGKMLDTGEVFQFENCHSDPVAHKAAKEWYESLDLVVGHNFLTFDAPELNRFLGRGTIDPHRVIDTLVISRMVDYGIAIPPGARSPHSLDAWGRRLGVYKGDFHKFDELTDEMREYWLGDLETTEALYNHFSPIIFNPDWKKSLRVEHDLQIELVRTRYYGFHFDRNKAEFLLGSIEKKMEELEAVFHSDFPPKLKPVNSIKYRTKKDGEPFSNITKAKEKYPITKRDGDELICYDFVPFKPGSAVDRIDVLWQSGWQPFEKTKTYNNFSRLKVGDPYGKTIKSMSQEFYNEKKEHLERYGWTVSEDNLKTLPEDAPEGAKALAQWLTLEGRRSSLAEWIGQCCDDDRIHGSINNVGAWTGRCSHKNPNTANIASPFHGEPKNAVEEIKKEYDGHLRACWDVPEGSWLVGCDADGIQLRVLADYLWRHFDADMYAKAIMEGKKEDETDIHNVNKKALGVAHATRDMAKTFIYSWLLGAGVAKTASILGVNQREASEARDRFEKSIDGLFKLKRQLVPFIADKGYFKGYDGRLVPVPSEHKTLAGMLQNGEAVLMKHTLLEFHKRARAEGINFKMVGFIHDEYQVEVIGSKDEAEHLGKIVAQSMSDVGEELGFRIPTPGSYDIGKNWAETH